MATLTLSVKTRTAYSRTFTDALVSTTNDTITVPGHGLAAGDQVQLTSSGTLPAGLVTTRRYFVISPSTDNNTFKVSLTSGGAAVDITGAAGGGTHTVTKVSTFADVVLPSAHQFGRSIDKLLGGFLKGTDPNGAVIDVQEDPADPVAAVGTITLTHANVTNNDTVTIGGVVITAKTSATDPTVEFTIGADATADAVALAATINANLTLSRVLTATSALGVVTLTMKVKGAIGNLVVLATSDGTAAALVQPTGGTGGPTGAVTTYSYGK